MNQVSTVERPRRRAYSVEFKESVLDDAAWLATAPLNMRTGMDSALARVVAVFCPARSQHTGCLRASLSGLPIRTPTAAWNGSSFMR